MNMYYMFNVGDEDFIIVNFTGLSCFNDGVDIVICYIIGDYNFQFYFRQEIDYIFSIVVQFSVFFLMVKFFDFRYCYICDVDFG